MAEFESIVEKATTSTNTVKDKSLSNRQRVKGIRENRGFEKEKRREEEAFELSKDESSNSVEQIKKGSQVESKASPKTTKSNQNKQKTKSFKRQKLEALKRNRLRRSIKDE